MVTASVRLPSVSDVSTGLAAVNGAPLGSSQLAALTQVSLPRHNLSAHQSFATLGTPSPGPRFGMEYPPATAGPPGIRQAGGTFPGRLIAAYFVATAAASLSVPMSCRVDVCVSAATSMAAATARLKELRNVMGRL